MKQKKLVSLLFLGCLIFSLSPLRGNVQATKEEKRPKVKGNEPINSHQKEEKENREKALSTKKEKAQQEKNDSVRSHRKNYNDIINGHGTGFIPLSKEEKQKIENSSLRTFTSLKTLSEGTKLAIPSAIDHTTKKWFPPIGNQGSEGSCTAWATTYYPKTFFEAKEHGWDLSGATWEGGHPSISYQDKIFSPDFVYHQINGGVDHGSRPYDAIQLISHVGACTWEKMPYNDTDHTSFPDEQAWREAPQYRGKNPGRFDLDSNQAITKIKNLLADGTFVTIAVDGYQLSNLEKLSNLGSTMEGDIWTTDNLDQATPNHAQAIVGYNDSLSYTEGGDTHSGAFRVANSWGTGWSGDHNSDGKYWISYEALKQKIVSYGYFYEDRIDYNPSLLSTFNMTHENRSECKITVGIGYNATDPLRTKRFAPFSLRGGDHPFPTNPIILDITEFESSLTKNMLFFLKVRDTGTSMTGTLESFSIERYYRKYNYTQSSDVTLTSPDPPMNTINDDSIYACIYSTFGSGWRYPRFNREATNYNPLSTSQRTSLELFQKWNVTGTGILTGDINGDGRLEVVGGYKENIFALTANGTILWNKTLPLSDNPRPGILADVTGDNNPEVICRTGSVDNGSKYVTHNYILGSNGTTLRILNKTGEQRDGGFHGEPFTILQNGTHKIIAMQYSCGYNLKPRGLSLFNYTTGAEIWHYSVGPPLLSPGQNAVGDVNEDGLVEFIPAGCHTTNNGNSGDGTGDDTVTDDSHIYRWLIDQNGDDIFTKEMGSGRIGWASVVNLNGDNDSNILVTEGHTSYYQGTSKIYLINDSGSILKDFSGPSDKRWLSIAIADLTYQSGKEIVALSENRSLFLLDSNLNLLHERDVNGSYLTVSDINGDEEIEIILQTTSGDISILSPDLTELNYFDLNVDSAGSCIKISDINMDGINEIIAETTERTFILTPKISPNLPVEIVFPGNHSNVSGMVEITIHWEDQNSDTGVLFLNSSILQTWHTSGNHSYSWNTTGLANKTFNLTFWANDTQGDENSTFIYVHVIDTLPPHITIETPKNGSTVKDRLLYVNWSAYDDEGIKYFHYYVNGTEKGTTDINEVNITLNHLGWREIRVEAVDTWGNINSDLVYIRADIDLQDPQITSISLEPSPVMAGSQVEVKVNISENWALENTYMYWNISSLMEWNTTGNFTKVPLTEEASGVYFYTTTSPKYQETVRVCFVIHAVDTSGNEEVSDVEVFKIYPSVENAFLNLKENITVSGPKMVKLKPEKLWPVILSVEFWLHKEGNSTLISKKSKKDNEAYSVNWSTASYPDGEYTFKAKIHAVTGDVISKSIDLKIDNAPPDVETTSFLQLRKPRKKIKAVALVEDSSKVREVTFIYRIKQEEQKTQMRYNASSGFYYYEILRPERTRTIQWKIVTTDKLNNTAIADKGEITIAGYGLSTAILRPNENATVHLDASVQVKVFINSSYSFAKTCVLYLDTGKSQIELGSHTITEKKITSFEIDTSSLAEGTYQLIVKVRTELQASANGAITFHLKEETLKEEIVGKYLSHMYVLPLSIGIISLFLIAGSLKHKKGAKKEGCPC